MTSMPASRSARGMIFAPRSYPSRPGLATTTRILRLLRCWALTAGLVGDRRPGPALATTTRLWRLRACGPRTPAMVVDRGGGRTSGARPRPPGRRGSSSHLGLVDRADDGVGPGPRQPVAEGAVVLVGGVEPHRA